MRQSGMHTCDPEFDSVVMYTACGEIRIVLVYRKTAQKIYRDSTCDLPVGSRKSAANFKKVKYWHRRQPFTNHLGLWRNG
jgi:hypothetical protein